MVIVTVVGLDLALGASVPVVVVVVTGFVLADGHDGQPVELGLPVVRVNVPAHAAVGLALVHLVWLVGVRRAGPRSGVVDGLWDLADRAGFGLARLLPPVHNGGRSVARAPVLIGVR